MAHYGNKNINMTKMTKPSLVGTRPLINKEEFRATYKNFIKQKKKVGLTDKAEIHKLGVAIMREISIQALEYPGGLLLKDFGYFFIYRIEKKLRKRITPKGQKHRYLYSHHTNNHVYSPLFIPVNTRYKKMWTMDGTFSKKFKRRLHDKLKSGERFLNFYPDFKHKLI
jgi:hypothetical protein